MAPGRRGDGGKMHAVVTQMSHIYRKYQLTVSQRCDDHNTDHFPKVQRQVHLIGNVGVASAAKLCNTIK